MHTFLDLFHAIFTQPIFNVLIALYDWVPGHDFGIAILILTVAVRLVLWPISAKAVKSQKALAGLQPKVDALKKKYPDKEQKEELAKELMALYSREKVSPASSCLPLLIQLPVIIALYRAMEQGLASNGFQMLYPFIPNPGTVHTTLLGIMSLSKPSLVLALGAGVTQFFQSKMMVNKPQPKGTPGAGDEQMLSNMNRQMTYIMPFITVFIGMKLPGGLTLYWFMTNLLTVVQQVLIMRGTDKTAVETVPAK